MSSPWRRVYLNGEHLHDLGLAARYLRVLRMVEQAHVLGNGSEVRALLDGVDPIEVQDLAGDLDWLRQTASTATIAVGVVSPRGR